MLIPFAPYQLATADMPPEFEPVVFRRFVRMVAERLASDLGYPAISTGDNLAQVASQTLQNLVCIDSGSSVPTLRPLLAFDKEEIVQMAKQIGTYEISLREYKDCCSIISRHPKTRMKVQGCGRRIDSLQVRRAREAVCFPRGRSDGGTRLDDDKAAPRRSSKSTVGKASAQLTSRQG